jgi:hypothetical protein
MNAAAIPTHRDSVVQDAKQILAAHAIDCLHGRAPDSLTSVFQKDSLVPEVADQVERYAERDDILVEE